MPVYFTNLGLLDAYGRRSVKRFKQNAADYATALTQAADLIVDFAAISLMRVEKYTVGQEIAPSDSVGSGANKDEGLTFAMDLGDGKRGVLKIPGPDKSVVNIDGTVDLTDGLVTALMANFTGPGPWTISDLEQPIAVISGKLDS